MGVGMMQMEGQQEQGWQQHQGASGCTQMRGQHKRVWATDWYKQEQVEANMNEGRQMQMGKCEQGWVNANEGGQVNVNESG